MTLGAGVFAGSWFLILTVLVLDLAGVLRRGTGFRWQAAGLLVINTAVGISAFAVGQRRPEFSALQPSVLPVILIGLAVFAMGVAIQVKGRRRGTAPR